MAKLTDKQSLFVEAYLECWNATEAARRAKYKHPRQMGSENLAKPAIKMYIEQRMNELRVSPDQVPKRQIRRAACFVYLFGAANGLIKIGKTVDVRARFKILYTMCPIELELLAVVKTELADELETRLHAEFATVRVKGEWFNLTEDDIDYIIKTYEFDRQAKELC